MEVRYTDADITEAQISECADALAEYREQLSAVAARGDYDAPESSINLPADDACAAEVYARADRFRTNNLKYIIIAGIGGSNLGTKALYDAHFGAFDALAPGRMPKVHFADTTDPELLSQLVHVLLHDVRSPGEFLVNIISKSGATTETIANAEVILHALGEALGSDAVDERTAVTTDVNSPLWQAAGARGITRLGIPETVGGRFSVFSAVGLFPLAVLGFDTEGVREGAREMRARCLAAGTENPAIISAAVLFNGLANGYTVNDNFIFEPELESLGKWYRQLMGESIGKAKNCDGETVNTGITPTVSIGSTDLHSVGQLYLGGRRDKLTTFIRTASHAYDARIPDTRMFPELVRMIEYKSASDIIAAIAEGTETAYRKQGLPFMDVLLPDMSAHSLGGFMQFKMMEMMYLGKLLNVDTFNQPNVESYKEATRRILET